jgi:hypothetical protein
MTLRTDVGGASNYALQEAIGAYSDEAYTNAKKLSGSGIVGPNPDIDKETETYIGQLRWFTTMNPTINVASLTSSTDGTVSTYGSDYLTYVKTVRTYGATKVNLQKIVAQDDGLAKIGRDFAEHKAQDKHDSILAVLKGVAISECVVGAAVGGGGTGLGGQTFDNDPESALHGMYVDLGAALAVTAASASNQGAARATGFLNAFGMAYKDYEPEYAYLVTSPEVMASLRAANLVDQDRVADGNINFQTIFDGKFRLISTRASQGLSSAQITKLNTGAGVDIVGTKTSFIVLPGAIAMEDLVVDEPVEIERAAAAYMGGGTTSVWHRWGYINAPAGYDWVGDTDSFPTNADYQMVSTSGTPGALTAATDVLTGVTGVYTRKATSVLSLGILPVFHS